MHLNATSLKMSPTKQKRHVVIMPGEHPTVKNTFEDFCEHTSLHGWQHIGRVKTRNGRLVWLVIVVASLGVASVFLATAAKDFANRSVVTTIDTTTASLQDVFFPTVIVCNINQIRSSLFRSLGVSNESDIDLLYSQFYSGMDRNLTQKEQEAVLRIATSEFMVKRLINHWKLYSRTNTTDIDVSSIDWREFLKNNTEFIYNFDYVKDMAVENPGDSPIISARFGSKAIRENATDFLPFFGTDFGFCSLVKPQLNFNATYDHLAFSRKMFGPKKEPISYSRLIRPGAKVGKANGLRLLLDAETFDYTFHKSASEGFKMAVQHHLDQPLMSVKELDISPGFETQIAVSPVLYATTDEAKHRFDPEERGCYFEGELTFKYLPSSLYRYDISNCLFEATYEKVLDECKCTPYFHWAGVKEHRNFCRGQSLLCMNDIFSRLGEYNEVEYLPPGAKEAENGSQKTMKKCLAACENQINEVAVTTSRLPNRETFLEWPDFCHVISKLVQTCQGWKRPELDDRYPQMCDLILSLKQEQIQPVNCDYIRQYDNATVQYILRDRLYRYARENLALVNIYIKQPVVTKILRDQRIPIIWFVANCGGILGLCMGFSIVTVFEVFHCLFKSVIFKMCIFCKTSITQQHQQHQQTMTSSSLRRPKKEVAMNNVVISLEAADAAEVGNDQEEESPLSRQPLASTCSTPTYL